VCYSARPGMTPKVAVPRIATVWCTWNSAGTGNDNLESAFAFVQVSEDHLGLARHIRLIS
jgi:hypothetical protein